jgi:hypothetical protein
MIMSSGHMGRPDTPLKASSPLGVTFMRRVRPRYRNFVQGDIVEIL